MIEFLDLTPELAREIADTGQPGLLLPGDLDAWAGCAVAGLAYAARTGGSAVAAGGIMPDFGRGQAWLIARPSLDFDIWKSLTRRCRAVIAEAHGRGLRRIEAHIHERFAPGFRFARQLGFELEAYCAAWLPDGSGAFQFSRFDPPLQARP